MTRGFPETSAGDGAFAINIARDTTQMKGHNHQENNQIIAQKSIPIFFLRQNSIINSKLNYEIKKHETQYHYNNDPSIPPQSEMMGTCQLQLRSGDQTFHTSQTIDLFLPWSTSNEDKI